MSYFRADPYCNWSQSNVIRFHELIEKCWIEGQKVGDPSGCLALYGLFVSGYTYFQNYMNAT